MFAVGNVHFVHIEIVDRCAGDGCVEAGEELLKGPSARPGISMFIVTQDAALSPCSGFDAHGSSLSTETGSGRTLASADRSSSPN